MSCKTLDVTAAPFGTSVLLEEKSEVTESTVLCCRQLFLSPIRTHRVTLLFAKTHQNPSCPEAGLHSSMAPSTKEPDTRVKD